MMTHFTFLAREQTGRIARGQLQAASPTGLKSLLHSMGLQLVSLEAVPEPARSLLDDCHPQRWLPPRSRDIEFALRQLAVMIRSGLNLLGALKALQSQTELVAFAAILGKVHQAVASGDSLAMALESHRVFPQIVVQLVSVGEQTGNLEQVLEQAAKYMTQRRTAIAEVRVALTYPAIVSVAAIGIAGYLIFAVIPELQKFLSAMGRKLPRMTQSLVDLAQWFQINGATACVFIAAAIGGLVVIAQWPPGRLWLDRWILKVPVIGGVLRLSATATLANSLSVMVSSGIKLVEALAVARRLQSNSYLAALLNGAADSVVRGKAFAPSLAIRDGFSPILGSMVEIAERTGHLDTTLAEVARFCDGELKSRIKRLSLLVEPAVIVVAGGIVGYVYIAFFMALMSAGGNFK
jgi:type II secretory pathway component PulF